MNHDTTPLEIAEAHHMCQAIWLRDALAYPMGNAEQRRVTREKFQDHLRIARAIRRRIRKIAEDV